MRQAMITVLIVDDHDLIRAGIHHMLSDASGIKVIGEADNGEEAMQMVRNLLPDVVLMDINMPGMGGIEATRKILHSSPDTKILVVTAYNDDLHPTRLLQIGVTGYLTKDASMEEMLQAVRSVYAGQRYISSSIAQQLVLKKVENIDKTPFDTLSSRELQVALMLLKGNKAKEISIKLNLSAKTVNSYRYRIYNKLKIKGDMELAHLAMQYNLIEP
jgi:two-component system, NarL family, invasion response regulator UvrY